MGKDELHLHQGEGCSPITMYEGDHVEWCGFEMEIVDINRPARWVGLAHIDKTEAYDTGLSHGGRGYTNYPAIGAVEQSAKPVYRMTDAEWESFLTAQSGL
jgi:hypothetical protein